MKSHLFRSRIAAWTTFGLVAASLAAIAPAANANGSGYSPTFYQFSRDESAPGSIIVNDDERVTIYSGQSLGADYAWPAPLKSVMSRSAFTQTTASMAGLTSLSDEKYRYWSGSSQADPLCSDLEDEGGYFFQETATLKITAGNRCLDDLSVTDQITVSNDTGSSKTVVTNSMSQVLKVGKRDVSNAVGAYRYFYGSVEKTDAASVTLDSSESSVSAYFYLCLNEDLVFGTDELTFDVSWSQGGSAVSSEDLEISYYDDNGVKAETYLVPEENPYDQVISFSVRLNTEDGTGTPIDATGTHVVTADVSLIGDLAGNSVLEECPPAATEPLWPEVTIVNGEGPQAATTDRDMPDGTFTGNSNWDRYMASPDGFGGAFHHGMTNDEGAGTATLVQLGATGPQNDYNGTGSRNIVSDTDGNFDLGRYGAAGANQFTLVAKAKGNWEYTSSTMTGASPVTRTFTKASLTRLCERGFTVYWMSSLSTPTVNPTAVVTCFKRGVFRDVLVSIVNNVPTVVQRLGTPTTTRPCVTTAFGSNSAATGTEVALIAYTSTTASDADGNCAGGDVNVSARSITTVTAAGVPTTTPLTANPWGDAVGEPYYIQITPGSSANEWVGMSFTRGEEWESIPANLFTMTGSAVTEGENITLDDTTDFGLSPQYKIVKKVSSGEWLMSINAGNPWWGGWLLSHDGEELDRVTVASVNTSTGVVTNGDIVELSGFGLYSWRVHSFFSGDGPNGTTYFAMTGEDSYSTTTWAP
jgi:hypothetical protein